jgi:threonine/homoserine/homoserine lactone efflux protein
LTPDGDMMLQLGVLSLSFLIIVSALDCCWALLADRLRALLTTRRRLRNRLTAAFYFFAATGLASVKRAA